MAEHEHEQKQDQSQSNGNGSDKNATAHSARSLFSDGDSDDLLNSSQIDFDSSSVSDTEGGRSERSVGTGGGTMLEAAEKGDKIISASRWIFFTVLCISAAVFASVSFSLYRSEETKNFVKSFTSQAEELILYTNHNVGTAFATLRGLSTMTTSVVKRTVDETQEPAGFVEIPDIQYHLGLARNTTDALIIAYMPKVFNEDYAEWVSYSEVHKKWVALDQPGGPVTVEPIITPYLWEYIDDPNWTQEHVSDLNDNSVNNNNASTSSSNTDNERTLRGGGGGGGGGDSRSLQQQQQQRSTDCSGDHFRRSRRLDDIPQVKVEILLNASYYAPVWQMVPVPIINETHPNVNIINYNLVDRPVFAKAVDYMASTRLPVFLDVCDQSAWFMIDGNDEILQTVVAFPVFGDFVTGSPIVGFYTAIIPWIEFFDNNLGASSEDIIIVMSNTCDEVFTVGVSGDKVTILGEEDMHDPKFDDMVVEAAFAPEYNRDDVENYDGEVCVYTMNIYPTQSYEDVYVTNRPAMISILILMVFLFTSLAFMLFDCLVTRRQAVLLNTALRQNAIVNSLFPKSVQKKLMDEAEFKTDKKNYKRSINAFLNEDGNVIENSVALDSKPIADLFPKTTIMFADISGFTAWSSAREPEAVFTLLETIYRAYDKIAKRRRVFKVEVIGDCYVAVCGLPDPNKDHYIVMCRFAQDCLSALQTITKELVVRLGPDTGELGLRVGLHSGPVVAGVLRGEKSRFQLFGDTMNTASRMESTGIKNRIQLSQTTADLLTEQGKDHWIIKRKDKVKAKGKGDLTTYFLLVKKNSSDRTNGLTASTRDEIVLGNNDKARNPANGVNRVQKRNRVADWVVEMLGNLLKEMAAKRELTGVNPDSRASIEGMENQSIGNGDLIELSNQTVIDEVMECLQLPAYSANGAAPAKYSVPLDKEVVDELRDYVYSIASMYNKNPFHNFEHASHVSMSCIKLLNRIASRDEDDQDGTDHIYDICSDPLTSFAIVFSALIHDVDHTGAPNAQLVKEHAPVAAMYKNKSVAEQNSIDVGWDLLMEPSYVNLRHHIYTTVAEYKIFRQLVVNCVMATDIIDKDLIKARNQRWDLAFSTPNAAEDDGHITKAPDSLRQVNSRKATAVIEHLVQLSDVAHTMQHWHIYRRWNECLFEESYVAYAECRAEKNPADNWYQGELGFYDFYIIPLAKKIKQCAVFGVTSDEYLSYALQNRQEWEERGKEVVEEMEKKMEAIHHAGISRQLLELEKGIDVSRESQTAGSDKETSA